MTEEAHGRAIVVWDVPSAVACADRFRCYVGIKCEAGCAPDGWAFDVLDHEGRLVVSATTGDASWPGTTGLSFRRVELEAPAATGLHAWQVVARATGGEAPRDREAASDGDHSRPGPQHREVRSRFNVRTAPPADCRLRVVAVERESGTPLAGMKVVVHPHQTRTDTSGTAELELPKGTFRLFVTGKDFFPFRCDGELDGNTIVRAELEPDHGPSDAELWS